MKTAIVYYTGLFQRRSKRISVPVKCFYPSVSEHHVAVYLLVLFFATVVHTKKKSLSVI